MLVAESTAPAEIPGISELVARLKENLSQDPGDWRTRQYLIVRLGEIGKSLARDDQLEAFRELVRRCAEDDVDEIRLSALQGIYEIWDAGWQTRRQTVLEQVREALANGNYEVRRAAIEWLGFVTEEIASDERLVGQVLDALMQTANEDQDTHLKAMAWDISKKIWQTGWHAKENPETYRLAVFTRFLNVLREKDEDSGDWEIRRAAADWLGQRAVDLVDDQRMVAHALDTLIVRSALEQKEDVKQSLSQAVKRIWDEGWKIQGNQDMRRLAVLTQLEKVLASDATDLQQTGFDWLAEHAAGIALDERVAEEVLDTLINSLTKNEKDLAVRERALIALRKIWDESWDIKAGREIRRPLVLEQVFRGLKTGGKDLDVLRQAAADWLGGRANEIVTDERMMSDALNVLFLRITSDEKFSVLRCVREASKRIWEAGWDLFSERTTTFNAIKRIQVAGKESWENREKARAAWRSVILSQVLKTIDKGDGAFKHMAMNWLNEKANDLGDNDRMVIDTLKSLHKRVDSDESTGLRRIAIEVSKRIWNAGWESQPGAILLQVIKVVEEDVGDPQGQEFKRIAINWLEDTAEEIALDYDRAEKVAEVLDKIRRDGSEHDDLRESANRAIFALWNALQKTFNLYEIEKKFETETENQKRKTIRKLANQNTLGSPEAVSFLVNRWVEWIYEKEEQPLVELASESLRYNEYSVLPLIEHFVKKWDEAQRDSRLGFNIALPGKTGRPFPVQPSENEALQLRLRRRISRQLAEMSDPRFYVDGRSYKHDQILEEMRDHVVPALARRLPEEKDVEILENMARTLLYIQEREAIEAVAREVVGEERTRKARKDLLAKYYLEPSKESSDQAADILGKAINESKRTLRILQLLNILVVLVGLAVLSFGLYISMFSSQAASRVAGGLAAIGGLSGVIYQLVRDPLNRIQRANSNLVQMETAFTSFIWELNLNGTFIQSSYVDNGELDESEIEATADRIEEGMQLTMDLVSVYAEEGKQHLVTRINRLEPAAGGAGSRITIHGQHLQGEAGQNRAWQNSMTLKAPAAAAGRLARHAKDGFPGMVAINHRPIDVNLISWNEHAVELSLPEKTPQASPLDGTVMVSLFIDGMETNALPFHLVNETGA